MFCPSILCSISYCHTWWIYTRIDYSSEARAGTDSEEPTRVMVPSEFHFFSFQNWTIELVLVRVKIYNLIHKIWIHHGFVEQSTQISLDTFYERQITCCWIWHIRKREGDATELAQPTYVLYIIWKALNLYTIFNNASRISAWVARVKLCELVCSWHVLGKHIHAGSKRLGFRCNWGSFICELLRDEEGGLQGHKWNVQC